MAKRKYSNEEIDQWRKEHHQTFIYNNKNDSNFYVHSSYGRQTMNLAHPGTIILIVVIVAWIIFRLFFYKGIFR